MKSDPTERPLRSIALRVFTRYGPRRIHARVQVVGETHVALGGKVELSLYQQRSGRTVETRTLPVRRGEPEEATFDTRSIPSGCCGFRAVLIDRHGQRFDTELLYERSPGRVPWLGAMDEVSRRVPAPWTPLETERSRQGVEIRPWGRRYGFGGKGLIERVEAAGRPLLADPVTVRARAEGRPVAWRPAVPKVLAGAGEQTILQGRLESEGGISLDARTEVDFDGMIRVDWAIASSRVARLDELTLLVPLKAEHAVYQYHFPGRWGEARNVGALPAKGLTMGFRPFVWLGDEERGLCCFAESERGRHLRDPEGMTRIRRGRGRVVLEIRLVDVPVKLLPGRRRGGKFTGYGEDRAPFAPGGVVTDRLRYTTGFQATPVRPMTRDAWDQRILCINQATPGFRPRFRVPGSLLDRIADAGVMTVVLFEHWADAEGHARTPHRAALKKVVADCRRRGLRVLLYFGFLISDIAPEWRDFGKDSVSLPKGGYPLYHYLPQPEQGAWKVCLNSAWQDFLAHGIGRVMEDFDVDGVYLDGTEYPFGCCNREHGCGTVRRDGSIAPSYPIFGVRSAMRRIHHAVRSRKPGGLINVHNSTCMTIPTLGWATSYWDGEQFQGVGRGADVARLLPLDAFRAEFMGRQWGVPAEFLFAGQAYTYEQAWAFCLLHDVPVRPHAPGPDLDLIASIWRVMDAFGRKDAEWLPYWENRACARTSARDSYVSLYRHPRNGVLAVVANLGKEPARIRLWLNAGRLGLPAGSGVTDALAGNTVPGSPGGIDLRMKSLDWKLLWLKG